MVQYGLAMIAFVFVDIYIDMNIIGKYSPDWFIWLRANILILGFILFIVGIVLQLFFP
jgi:hypothetical protein